MCTSATSACDGSKPGLTAISRMKLFVANPAPTTSITAIAISASTSPPRSRCPRAPTEPRVSERSVCSSEPLVARNAGRNPKSNPESTDATKVNVSIAPSMRTLVTPGRSTPPALSPATAA